MLYKISRFSFLLLTFLFISFTAKNALTAGVGVTFDPSPDDRVVGYKLHYGLSENFGHIIDLGTETLYYFSDLQEGTTYYFGATAYDDLGNESDFSNIVEYKVPQENGSLNSAIIDNTDSGFTRTGSWDASINSPGYYGTDYLYSDPGIGYDQAMWTFLVVSGDYEISARWTTHSNRASNAKYRVYNNGIEIGTQVFDQTFNGGQFNVFDNSYILEDGTLDIVLTDDADGYVIADAVQVTSIDTAGNLYPNGEIDTPASNVTIVAGDVITFKGTGSDPDGNTPLTFHWDFGDSDIADAIIEDPDPVVFNNIGIFTVTFTVTDSMLLSDPTPATLVVNVLDTSSEPVIIDNSDSAFSMTGGWKISSYSPGFNGSDYLYNAPGTGIDQAQWSFFVISGEYEISARWASHSNRASNAKYRVYNNGIEIGTKVFDQRFNSDQFNVFGNSYILEDGTLDIVLTDDADGYVIADVVKLVGPFE